MARLLGRGLALAAFAVAVALSGCARPTGDFGRAAPDALHDDLMPAIGKQRARAAGEPVSAFNLTDEEREMADRVWRFLVAPHAYDWFGDTVVELQRTRLAPLSKGGGKPELYYQWLHSERFASSRVRFARVSDDALADIGTVPGTFRSICAVREIDRQRGVASSGIAGLEDDVLRDAAARHAENEAMIGWFVRALTLRYDAYSYALDHLLVETPHEEAVDTTLSSTTLPCTSKRRSATTSVRALRGGRGAAWPRCDRATCGARRTRGRTANSQMRRLRQASLPSWSR